MYDSFDGVEYEYFVFQMDSMHKLVYKDEFQFDVGIHEHADFLFHNEQEVEVMKSFNMHYEDESGCFVLPIEEIEDMFFIGKIDMNESFSLPQGERNEN